MTSGNRTGEAKAKLQKNHVVQTVSRSKPVQTGVVKWVSKNGDGTLVALVRWDGSGNHILHTQDQLRIATIALKAYDRVVFEKPTDSGPVVQGEK